MNEQTIKELMQPIRAYIQSNKVTYNDIHIVVANLFPDEDKVREVATYLKDNYQHLKSLTDDKLYERTRQVLTNALQSAALDVFYAKEGYEENEDVEGLVDEDWEVGEVDDDWDEYEG